MTNLQYWNLTQNWEYYCDFYNLKIIKTFENKIIGSYGSFSKSLKTNEYILFFKGTEPKLNDILIDMFFKKILLFEDNNKIKVHGGFFIAISSILMKIEQFIQDNNIKKIVVIGHSLGAAMSILFEALSSQEVEKKLILFGSPRVGNKYLKKYLENKNIISYINKSDIVCKLPFKILNWHHCGKIINVGKLGLSIKEHLLYNKYLI